MATSTLSKTSLLKGIQCPKALYLSKNPPPVEIPPDPGQEATFQMGREVGMLARQLFPGGTEVLFSNHTLAEQIDRTRELIKAGVNIIYEGAFVFDDIFIKADILVRSISLNIFHEKTVQCQGQTPLFSSRADPVVFTLF